MSARPKAFRELAADTTRGCIVLERPDLLAKLVDDEQATDGTVRGTAMEELQAMQVRTSQYSPNPATAIPEKSLAYRLAKRLFFNDFGTYSGRDHSQASAPAMIARGEVPTQPEPVIVELETS